MVVVIRPVSTQCRRGQNAWLLVPSSAVDARHGHQHPGGYRFDSASTWLATLLTSFCIIVLHILQVSARQMLCPEHLFGRVGATMEFMIWGIMPVGSLLGGVLATVAGMRATLWVDGAAILLASLWLVSSPLRLNRDIPTTTAPA